MASHQIMLLGSTMKYRIMNAGGQMKTIVIGYLPININQSVEYSHGETPLELMYKSWAFHISVSLHGIILRYWENGWKTLWKTRKMDLIGKSWH